MKNTYMLGMALAAGLLAQTQMAQASLVMGAADAQPANGSAATVTATGGTADQVALVLAANVQTANGLGGGSVGNDCHPTPTPVPEPTTIVAGAICAGMLGLGLVRRKK